MTRMTDLIHNVKPIKTASGTVAGEVVDTLGYYATYFLALADEETFTVQESDNADFSEATDVPASQIKETDNAVNVVQTKRYVKVTVAGASKVAGLLFGADIDGTVNL